MSTLPARIALVAATVLAAGAALAGCAPSGNPVATFRVVDEEFKVELATLEFADVTIEVCDGLPSYVEDGTVTSDQYCPWSAEIASID